MFELDKVFVTRFAHAKLDYNLTAPTITISRISQLSVAFPPFHNVMPVKALATNVSLGTD